MNDELIAEHARNTPGGLMTAQKRILKEFFEKEDKLNNRDYVHGWDEGESKISKYK